MSSFLHLSRPVIHGGFTLWLRDACDQNVSPPAGGLKAWAGAAEIIAAAARGSAQNLATFGSNGRADLTELRLNSLSAPAFDTSLTLHFELQPPLPGVALPPPLRVKYSDLKSLNAREQERRAQQRQQAEAQARLQAEKLHALQELSEHFERARQQLSAEPAQPGGDAVQGGGRKVEEVGELVRAAVAGSGGDGTDKHWLQAFLQGLGTAWADLAAVEGLAGHRRAETSLLARSGLRDSEQAFAREAEAQPHSGLLGVVAQLFEVQNVGDEAVSRTLAGLLSTLTRRDLSSLLCRTYRAAQLVAQQARQRQLKLSYRNIPEQPYRGANSMGPPAMNGVPFAMLPDAQQRRELLRAFIITELRETIVVRSKNDAELYMQGLARMLNTSLGPAHFGVGQSEVVGWDRAMGSLASELRTVRGEIEKWRNTMALHTNAMEQLQQQALRQYGTRLPLPQQPSDGRTRKRARPPEPTPSGAYPPGGGGSSHSGILREDLD
ncbi:hypothetical protein EMIHUDRAFT_201849 [Emiliania huxleyi CCMP1516]|uniref:Uncharacterized protein n=2 Tax=Emiliania huxleyi TaxID=2903 RepID=A0A0D3KEL5_EMIH1|nr:hypothetical protein EMIHUDRAFT_201849 [Emiliania huxleyi CCMP1516]EOD34200.1 hypothetical protein EMIHUDRAFT_201849 [Emiliania huxleyi CCMP1516]|eukprot:XP_005786629.1 hypothetical protein EMIHUDRAFT_201849 [Emiliania huxleyi CCMP1516]